MQFGLPFDTSAPSHAPVPPPPDADLEFYFVRHHRARRYLLRVDADGRVRVTIPRGGSRRLAGAFAERHLDWIRRQRARVTHVVWTPSDRLALRARAAVELPPALLRRAADFGLTVSRVSVRNQRSRWGSCGRDGHVSLNWRLLLMPDAVRDYVMVHELMHLRRLDHSPAYWALVAEACPDFRTSREWLRRHGPSLQ